MSLFQVGEYFMKLDFWKRGEKQNVFVKEEK